MDRLPRGLLFVLLFLGTGVFAAVGLVLFLEEGSELLGAWIDGPVANLARVIVLLAATGVMWQAWRVRNDWWADACWLLACNGFALLGYVDSHPKLLFLLPGFILPWAMLFVDLAPRHRFVLLVLQWLATAAMLELWTGTVASTALLAVAYVHIVLVWTSLPAGRLRWVPIVTGLVIGTMAIVTTLFFIVQEPTWRRFIVLAVSATITAGCGFLLKVRPSARRRLPIVFPGPGPRPSPVTGVKAAQAT